MSFTPVTSIADNFLCPLCLDIWVNPVLVVPCGHLYCSACLRQLSSLTCPLCRGQIVSLMQPDNYEMDASRNIQVSCDHCDWVGKHGERAQHTCSRPHHPATDSTPLTPEEVMECIRHNASFDRFQAVLQAIAALTSTAVVMGETIEFHLIPLASGVPAESEPDDRLVMVLQSTPDPAASESRIRNRNPEPQERRRHNRQLRQEPRHPPSSTYVRTSRLSEEACLRLATTPTRSEQLRQHITSRRRRSPHTNTLPPWR